MSGKFIVSAIARSVWKTHGSGIKSPIFIRRPRQTLCKLPHPVFPGRLPSSRASSPDSSVSLGLCYYVRSEILCTCLHTVGCQLRDFRFRLFSAQARATGAAGRLGCRGAESKLLALRLRRHGTDLVLPSRHWISTCADAWRPDRQDRQLGRRIQSRYAAGISPL